MYEEVGGAKRQVELEQDVLAMWKKHGVFPASQERRRNAPRFTFYEGPPTANGRPGIHHVLARTLKDVICRYKHLAGFAVERKAGWDTHGLPVEVEVEKRLGIHGKDAIRAYGVEAFTKQCIDSVFTYTEDWERLTDRIGYWLDLANAYVTYHEPFVESVWWSLAELHRKGLLYQGHKIVWWWPQGGTALSSAEVGLGYRETTDPSVVCRFRIVDERIAGKPSAFLAWTTTPWTLPSNVALAVAPSVEYGAYDLGDEVVILAAALSESVLAGKNPVRVGTFRGEELVGRRYEPPYSFAPPEGGTSCHVVPADFVTTDSGTGIVHIAPAFGEDDNRLGKKLGLGFLQLVEPNGAFAACTGPFAGKSFKDADKDVIRDLKHRGLLLSHGQYRHDYPFCWRAQDDPLMQYARSSWFIRTTAVKDRMLALNNGVAWYPEHIREGRFGDFLRNNVDWALSRERFWGTPLPIWINDTTGDVDCIGSVAEILERNPDAFRPFEEARREDPKLSPHLRVHKPWIDDVVWTKPGVPGTWRRVPDVIDCWYDSGAMPFAQRHYPFENRELFESSFPADYICEGLDQTRGWFYSLLAVGTMLFDRSPYRSVIVNGLVNDKDGRKMSKSLGNTVNPWDVLERHGADPLRWYLLAGSPPWTSKSFDLEGVAEIERKIFGTLWPSFNFFALYANAEEWTSESGAPPIPQRPAMDRWILSRAESLLRDYRAAMDDYDPMRATRLLGSFLVDELSNWYIRRNRARFWKSDDDTDRRTAFDTLHRALRTVALLLGPIAPFSADRLWRGLHPSAAEGDSVHYRTLPAADPAIIDAGLELRMAAVLEIVTLGRAAREQARIKVRQPLSRLLAAGPDRNASESLADDTLVREIRDELNVKEVALVGRTTAYCTLVVKPNLPVLGPRLGKNLGTARQALARLGEAELAAFEETGTVTLDLQGTQVVLGTDDLLVERNAKEGYAVATARGYMAAIETTLTPELLDEGLAREVVSRIQAQRKAMDLEITNRIRVEIGGPATITHAARLHHDRITDEVFATELSIVAPGAPLRGSVAVHEIDGLQFRVGIMPLV